MISLAMVYIWAELNKEDQAKYIGVHGAFYNVAKWLLMVD